MSTCEVQYSTNTSSIKEALPWFAVFATKLTTSHNKPSASDHLEAIVSASARRTWSLRDSDGIPRDQKVPDRTTPNDATTWAEFGRTWLGTQLPALFPQNQLVEIVKVQSSNCAVKHRGAKNEWRPNRWRYPSHRPWWHHKMAGQHEGVQTLTCFCSENCAKFFPQSFIESFSEYVGWKGLQTWDFLGLAFGIVHHQFPSSGSKTYNVLICINVLQNRRIQHQIRLCFSVTSN